MAKRYRITRAFQNQENPAEAITLEECQELFAARSDFSYRTVYTVNGSVSMSVEGHFFMWNHNGMEIPFRFYEGDIYVSGVNEAVVPIMLEVASELRADVAEG